MAVYTHREIEGSIRRIAAVLGRTCDRSASTFMSSSGGKLQLHTQIQALFGLKFISELDRLVYELLMTHAVAAEKVGPGGFNRSVELLLTNLRGTQRHVASTKLSSDARVATHGDIDGIIERCAAAGGTRTVAMVKKAMALAGFNGRVVVEKTTSAVPSIEQVNGYTFSLQALIPVDVSFVRPRVACIDGYVETVSEIHHLLEAAAEAKEPCVVFLRGASDDVKHTVKVNFDRGSLRVIPVEVPYDLDGINTLVDLATVCGCDLTSSLKGDLISSIKFDELPRVDQLTAYKGRVVIAHAATKGRVAQHLAELRTRREDPNIIEDVGKMLDARIRSLSSNHVIIRVPDDKDFVVNSQAIDLALRSAKAAIERGITAEGVLAVTELAARAHANRCMKSLDALGCCLL